MPASRSRAHAIDDGGDLRHAGAGDHPGGADRSWTDADLDAVGAALGEVAGALSGGDVAGQDAGLGKALTQGLEGVQHAEAVGVGGVEHQQVGLGLDEGLGALEVVAAGADRGAHPQAAQLVFAGVRILEHLFDVFVGDQPGEQAVFDHRQLLDAMLVEQLLGLLEGGAGRHGDQVVAGHQLADRTALPGLETQVAVGQDADQLAAFVGDRHAGDLEPRHDPQGFGDLLLGANGHRIDDHAGLGALDLVDLLGLLLDGEVLVDEADAAFLGQRDRQCRLGHGIHGRRHQRRVERDAATQLGGEVDVVGVNLGEAGLQEHVVKGQCDTGRCLRASGATRSIETGHRLGSPRL